MRKLLLVCLLLAGQAQAESNSSVLLKGLMDGLTQGIEEKHPEYRDMNRARHDAEMRRLEEQNLRLENQRLQWEMMKPPDYLYTPPRRHTECTIIGNHVSCY